MPSQTEPLGMLNHYNNIETLESICGRGSFSSWDLCNGDTSRTFLQVRRSGKAVAAARKPSDAAQQLKLRSPT
jgi:hypothetical protein